MRPSSRVPKIAASPRPAGKGGGGTVAWAMAGVAVMGFIVFGQKGGTPASNGSASNPSNIAQAAIADRIAELPKSPIEPLAAAGLRKGRAHLRLAAVEGLSGEMIYSQNCYDGVTRRFSWAQLDVCGAFDAAAAAALGDDAATGFDKEVAWFDEETAAGRYLKAANTAGLAPEAADQRLADLRSSIPRSASSMVPIVDNGVASPDPDKADVVAGNAR